MTDSHALERYVATQDPEAFAHLVQCYGQMVYATCLRTLGHVADAEDAAQDTFVQLAKSAGSIRSNVAAWLHRTATNVSISRMRSAGRRRAREAAAAKPPRVADAAADVAWAEIRDAVDEVLSEMPDADRGLIVQRYLVGRTQADLAAEHDVSTSMMSRRMNAAVKGLRERLRKRGVLAAAGTITLGLSAEAAVAVPAGLSAGAMKVGLAGVAGAPVAGFSKTAAGAWLLLAVLVVGVVIAITQLIPIPDRRDTGADGSARSSVSGGSQQGGTPIRADSPRLQTIFAPSVETGGKRGTASDGEGIRIRGYDVPSLVTVAFEVDRRQLIWDTPVPEGRFDIALDVPDPLAVMRSELAHQFSLGFAWQQRSVEVWRVTSGGWAGHKLAPTSQPDSAWSHTDNQSGRVAFKKSTIGTLASQLSGEMDAFVFDETGDEERYDFVIPRRGADSQDAYVKRIAGLTGLRIERAQQTLPFLLIGPKPRRFALRAPGGLPSAMRPATGHAGGVRVSGEAVFDGAGMHLLCANLELWMNAEVVDETGLAGRYDFTLKVVDAKAGAPAFIEAVRRDLGLELVEIHPLPRGTP